VGDEMQQLGHFGLESVGMFAHGLGSKTRGGIRGQAATSPMAQDTTRPVGTRLASWRRQQ
jgi:hypothetical protein